MTVDHKKQDKQTDIFISDVHSNAFYKVRETMGKNFNGKSTKNRSETCSNTSMCVRQSWIALYKSTIVCVAELRSYKIFDLKGGQS